MLQAGFELVQKLSSSFDKWSFAVEIHYTTAPLESSLRPAVLSLLFQSSATSTNFKPATSIFDDDDEDDDDDEFFVEMLGDERWQALFPAGVIVRDSQHSESLKHHKQYLYLRRT